jgi:hypothetical protein
VQKEAAMVLVLTGILGVATVALGVAALLEERRQ